MLLVLVNSHQDILPHFVWLYRKIGKSKKMEIQFFHQRHELLTSFDKFVTYRVTNFLPKLLDMLLFSMEKNEVPFLVFPYFLVMPFVSILLSCAYRQRWLG